MFMKFNWKGKYKTTSYGVTSTAAVYVQLLLQPAAVAATVLLLLHAKGLILCSDIHLNESLYISLFAHLTISL